MGRMLAWLAVLGLMIGLTAFYQALTGPSGGMVESFNESGRAMIVLQRERSGHFTAEGTINGQSVLFLVDTGATDVAISEKSARAMGLEFGPSVVVMTAAGPAGAWMTRLDSVSVGNLVLENVRAMITTGLGDEALLGMSFLKHFNLSQVGDQLIIESGAGASEGAGAG